MRVLQIHNRYRERGGEDLVVETDAATIAGAGHELRRFEAVNPGGARALPALAAAPWNTTQARRLRNEVRRFRPDVAHVHNTWFALSPAVVHTLLSERVPVVATMHNHRLFCLNAGFSRDDRFCDDCLGHVPWRGVVHACYRGSRAQSAAVALTSSFHRALRTWDRVDALIVPTRTMKETYVSQGFSSSKLHVSPWTVGDPGPRAMPPSGSREVVYLGRLERAKGLLDLIEAWRLAGPRMDRLTLRIVGDGPLREELESRLPPGAALSPWLPREEVERLLLGARAVVCPSHWEETFGLVVVEAFSAGLPVMVSDRGNLPALAQAQGVPWIVPAGDVEAWSRAMPKLLDDGELDEVGRRNRERFLAMYGPEAGASRLIQVYETARLASRTRFG